VSQDNARAVELVKRGTVELVLGAGRSLYRREDCVIWRTKVVSNSRPLRRPSDLHRPRGVICASRCARATTIA